MTTRLLLFSLFVIVLISSASQVFSSPNPGAVAAVTVDLGADYLLVPNNTTTRISSNVTGDVSTYDWAQISGPTTASLDGKTSAVLIARSMKVDNTYSSQSRPEGYVFRLTVTDAQGNTAFDEVNVKLGTPAYSGSKIQATTYQKRVTGWDTSPYLSYKFVPNGNPDYYMPFRILYPKGYDSRGDGKKYPLLLVIHGRGERGTDNDFQLKNGGKIHLDAVNNGDFDGFVVFPQYPEYPNSTLPSSNDVDRMHGIVQELIAREKVDVNRVHVHGLSTGGRTTWEIISLYPQTFAAAMPLAWSEPKYEAANRLNRFKHMPLWVSQGGQDAVAPPERGNSMVTKLRSEGANVRYLYFPTKGHNVWDATYRDPDFFPFFMRHHKTDIMVYYGQTSFCEDDVIKVKLGVTEKFNSYEWRKDGNLIATDVNEIVVITVGSYTVRFKRGDEWTPWSVPVEINRNRDPSPTPALSANKKSVHLPSLDGRDEVTLHAGTGYAQYLWYKNGQLIDGATLSRFTTGEAGTYTVTGVEAGPKAPGIIPAEFRPEPARCESLPSKPIVVTTKKGPNAPQAPSNLFALTRSATSAELRFNDQANNETGFEIYRATQPGGPYVILDIITENNAANPAYYLDKTLKSGTQYYYKIRAINDDGGSDYSNEAKVTTPADTQAPSAPQNLKVVQTTRSAISIQWDEAQDDTKVAEYLIYQNGQLIATTDKKVYTAEGLVGATAYTYMVRAKDEVGNISSPSNQVTGASVNNGLFYSYYHVSGIGTVNDIVEKGVLIKTGYLDNFSLSPKERNTDYAFIYEGFIHIETGGEYTFFLSSDDGSRLFIGGNEVINHDGDHACDEKSTTISLSQGSYPIKVLFYQKGGGDCLNVKWKAAGIAKAPIPDEVLRDDFTYPQAPATPANLLATAGSFKQINLNWVDKSSDETGFEIYRAVNSGGPYEIVYTVQANSTSYSDTTLAGNKTYYYKVKAVNAKSTSSFSSVASAMTQALPAQPDKPANLVASVFNPSAIQLNWSDQSDNETVFELWRTTSATGNGFTLVKTLKANETTYTDLGLSGNTSLYYKLRAKGDGGYSDFTEVVSATTSNNNPELQEILSRTVRFNTTLSFDIFVKDNDQRDSTNFVITGLPAFGGLKNNKDRTATFTFSPKSTDGGSYTIQVKAVDQFGGESSRSFTITVNNNYTPEITAISNQLVNQGGMIAVNVNAMDGDGNASLKLSLFNHPSFITLKDNGTGKGVITIKPGMLQKPGLYENIQVMAEDQQGGIGTSTFDVTVKAVDKDFTVYINFSHGNYAQFPWNNTGDASATNVLMEKLVDEEGKQTAISLKLKADSENSWKSIRETVNSDFYTEDVRDTRYWLYGGSRTLTLSGLNPNLNYNFTFFGSEFTDNDKSIVVQYSIGTQRAEIQTKNNSDQTAVLTNIKPDQNGQIVIQVARKGSDWKTIISSMIFQGYYDDGSAPVAPTNLSGKAVSASEVALKWVDNAKSESGFEILRATNSNGPFAVVATTSVNITRYTDSGLAGRTTYFYQVRAYSNNGLSASSNTLTVITPNSAPRLEMPNGFVVKVGTTQKITIKGIDPEGDPVTLKATGLPSFASFTDRGDGTATLVLSPFTNKSAGNYDLTFTATDDRSDIGTKKVIVTVISDEFDNAVYINFGQSDASAPWNNTSSAPVSNQTISNLKDAFGNASQVTLTPVSGWDGADKLGVNTGNNSGIYTDSVMRSYWYSNSTASITLNGLATDKTYNLVFFASHQNTQEGTTAYTINDDTVQLNAASNSQQTVQLNGLIPNSNGQLVLSVSKGQYSSGAYLGAIVLQSYATQAPVSPVNLKAQAQSQTKVKLTWADQAGNETGYQVYRSLSRYGSYALIASLAANTTSYVDHSGTKNTTYFYKVQAVTNMVTSDYSNTVSTTTYEYMLYINFVGNDTKYTYPGSPWNNTKASPSTGLSFNNLKNSDGNTTSVDLVLTEWETAGFDNNLGMNTGNNSGIYPDAVLESFYFTEGGEHVNLTVKDLNASYQYSFIFLGSGNPNDGLFQSAGNLTTRYTIGQQSVQQNALNNSQETVQIDGIIPGTGNDVLIDIRPESYANYAIFNAMVIGAYTAPQQIVDNEAPSAPSQLVASEIAPTSITLSWNPSSDNSGEIAYYEIYQGGQLVKKVDGNKTSQMIGNTSTSVDYQFSVLAVDGAGNKSPNSEVLNITYEVFKGLNYVYYEGNWATMPDYQQEISKKTGFVDNFSLTPKERNENFGFRFYGYLQIDNPGDYTFYTKSNTGSKLYIDNREVVNNDYANDVTERSGSAYKLSAGKHAIMVDYRNATEADLLEVRYAGPGVNKMTIPDSKLYRTDTVKPVSQPVEFLEVTASQVSESIVINWSTASEYDNEKFTIEKSYNLDTFVSIGEVAGAGNSQEIRDYSFTDTNLKAGNVYYRIRQTDFDGHGKLSKIVSIHVNTLNQLYDVRLFPNPTESDNINIKVLSDDYSSPVQITIVDLSSRTISVLTLPGSDLGVNKKLDVASMLPAGTYIINFTQGHHTVFRRVIIR